MEVIKVKLRNFFIGILIILFAISVEGIVDRVIPNEKPVEKEFELVYLHKQEPLEEDKWDVNLTKLSDEEYNVLINTCKINNIDPSLALGLIQHESNFNPNAKSKANCYGYMQLNPKYHPANLSPVENIEYGINYLASNFNKYGNLESGLTAYNAGHDTKDTRYARVVLQYAEQWDALYSEALKCQ